MTMTKGKKPTTAPTPPMIPSTTIAERMGFEANTLGEFYEEWTKYEATYKLGKEVEYGSVACFDLDDYILTAVSEDPCEEFDLFFQEDTEESCEEE